MLVDTPDSMAELLQDLGLLESSRFEELHRLAAQYRTPRDLARHLIRQEWLTAFQANQLLQGKGDQLVVGPYILLERIGEGGMGEVFKGRHRRLHRLAAIKVIARKRLQNQVALARFNREVEAAAQLSHPNIVAVHDAGAEGERFYLSMELLEGMDLGHLVRKTGPLPIPLACDLIRQSALGLHHAHELGFVHRDIKPQNLFVCPRGGKLAEPIALDRLVGSTVKILDMGLIRQQPHRLDEAALALTQHGLVLGTLDYLAPEQARNAHLVDRRADLYSLGCTMYQLLTGKPPFEGATAFDRLMKHQNDLPEPLRHTRLDVTADLDRIVARLLAKEPADRFATAADLVAALLPFIGAAGVNAVPVINPSTLMEPTRHLLDLEQETPSEFDTEPVQPPLSTAPSFPRPRWWWALGPAGLLLLLTVIFWPHSQPVVPDEPPPKASPRTVVDLSNYLPADALGVLHLAPRTLFGPTFWKKSKPQTSPALNWFPLLGTLGVDAAQDLDWMRVCFSSFDPHQTLWMARGSLPVQKIRSGGKLLASQGSFELFSFEGSSDRPSYFIGLSKEILLLARDRSRIEDALAFARGGPARPVKDALLREALGRIDRTLPLWLLVSPGSLFSTPDQDTQALGLDLRAVLAPARIVHGHWHCDDKLHSTIDVQTGDEDSCQKVQKRLRELRSSAGWEELRQRWVNENATGLPQVLLVLLRTGTLTRVGTTIRLTSEIRPGQL
ncbi:MAG: serine/threonine-protein kinase [Gemmataceae bacterium]